MPKSPSEWKRTFEILEEYETVTEGIGYAEHDTVYLGANTELFSAEHLKELEELGWMDYGEGTLHTFV